MDAERQALLQFKHGLTDEAHRLASWVAQDTDCCTWVGIVCDNSTGHVHRIHLPGLAGRCVEFSEFDEESKQRLKGDISPSLLDLKQLKHLDLSCDDFGGIEVPKFIGFLENLRYLNLSNSNFGGIIPPQIGNLSKLNVLCLGKYAKENSGLSYESTSIMNMKWLISLGMLHHLDLSGVGLSKATDWLQVINTLPSLVQLHLSHCELHDIHPYVPSLNLTSLSLLDISFNNFDRSLPQWIFSLTSLVSLDLSGCHFHSFITSNTYSFRNLTSIELLDVEENSFINSSEILGGLSNSKLVSLDISSCGVSSSTLESLRNLTSLLSLDLSQNQLTKRIHKSLGNLCNLREIDLLYNNFGNISLSYLLKVLFKCKSPALESLSLDSSSVSSHLPNEIAQLSFLTHLLLSNNSMVGTIPHSVGHLSSLRILDLSRNQFCGSIPYTIGYLSSLKSLSLTLNQLSGNLPHSLGQLSKLVHLDFSYNSLTGDVTKAHFAKLLSLKYLRGCLVD